jgi:hypothetical protein
MSDRTSTEHREASRLLAAAITFIYATYPMLGIHFLWFSSGLHRLPYAVASLWALDRWLSYRATGRPRELALIALAVMVATGFYAKGPLVALHLVALEIARHGPFLGI